jgi:hypothetical protein
MPTGTLKSSEIHEIRFRFHLAKGFLGICQHPGTLMNIQIVDKLDGDPSNIRSFDARVKKCQNMVHICAGFKTLCYSIQSWLVKIGIPSSWIIFHNPQYNIYTICNIYNIKGSIILFFINQQGLYHPSISSKHWENGTHKKKLNLNHHSSETSEVENEKMTQISLAISSQKSGVFVVVFHGLIQTNSGLILVFQGLEPTQTMKPW